MEPRPNKKGIRKEGYPKKPYIKNIKSKPASAKPFQSAPELTKPKAVSSTKPYSKPVPSSVTIPENEETSWGGVSSWYAKHLEGTDTYHAQVILPRLKRILGDVKQVTLLDLACGQGYFASTFSASGAQVTGVDISKELIEEAEKNQKESAHKVRYVATPADDIYMIKDKSQDIVVCVLALQNIENITGVFKEVSRVLKKEGKFFFVLNHPSFRVPRESSWGYDEVHKKQYRRIDEYLSESKIKMDMTPGSTKDKKYTVSFHRPLQFWSKMLAKQGFAISRMEEWESHKISQQGPRGEAENKARKEFPLFLLVEAVHL